MNINGIIRKGKFVDDELINNDCYGLEYKREILKIIENKNIKCLIDIHGCKSCYEFDIDIGTNFGNNTNNNTKLLNILVNNLSTIGKVEVDGKFTATKEEIISNYIHKESNIPCFQIEISAEIREDKERLLEFINSMKNALIQIKNELKEI